MTIDNICLQFFLSIVRTIYIKQWFRVFTLGLLGSSPGGGNSNPLQYFCLGKPMDRGAWRATVQWSHRVDTTEATEHIAPHFRVNTLDQHSFSTSAFYYMLKKKKKFSSGISEG